jgi:toxin ParE1/3/4
LSRLLIRPLAEQDLEEIWFYIAQDSADTADAWIDQLVETAEKLADTPGMGRGRDELLPGMRSFSVGRYILFYQAIEDGIDLVRVLSGYRDLDGLDWADR